MRTQSMPMPYSLQLPFIILALVCAVMAVLLVSISSMMSAQYDAVLSELNEVRGMISAEAIETPVPNGAIFEDGIVIAEVSDTVGTVESDWVDDRVIVPTTKVHENSLILITPFSEPVGRWWIGAITTGESFTVFSSAPEETMQFQWFIVDRR